MKADAIFKFLLLGAIGAVMLTPFIRDVDAAPSDVRGSGNIAVDSFKNSQGTFLLFSDGRITKFDSGETVAPPYSDEVPGFVRGSVQNASPMGSPNVAVSVVPHKKGTYVLFADGSVKNPINANKPASSGDIVTGIILTSPGGPAGPEIVAGSGFRVEGGANSLDVHSVTFDEPFDEIPTVVLTTIGGNTFIPSNSPAGPPNDSGQKVFLDSVSRSGFKYAVKAEGQMPTFHFAAFAND